jgi:hypothetical protein
MPIFRLPCLRTCVCDLSGMNTREGEGAPAGAGEGSSFLRRGTPLTFPSFGRAGLPRSTSSRAGRPSHPVSGLESLAIRKPPLLIAPRGQGSAPSRRSAGGVPAGTGGGRRPCGEAANFLFPVSCPSISRSIQSLPARRPVGLSSRWEGGVPAPPIGAGSSTRRLARLVPRPPSRRIISASDRNSDHDPKATVARVGWGERNEPQRD